MALGGFSAVAADLTERFGLDPPMDRRRVYEWNRRRTRNRNGQMFPSPRTARNDAPAHRPRLLFDLDQVAAWVVQGIPGPHGQGWMWPGNAGD